MSKSTIAKTLVVVAIVGAIIGVAVVGMHTSIESCDSITYYHDEVHEVGVWRSDYAGRSFIFVLPEEDYQNFGLPWSSAGIGSTAKDE